MTVAQIIQENAVRCYDVIPYSNNGKPAMVIRVGAHKLNARPSITIEHNDPNFIYTVSACAYELSSNGVTTKRVGLPKFSVYTDTNWDAFDTPYREAYLVNDKSRDYQYRTILTLERGKLNTSTNIIDVLDSFLDHLVENNVINRIDANKIILDEEKYLEETKASKKRSRD